MAKRFVQESIRMVVPTKKTKVFSGRHLIRVGISWDQRVFDDGGVQNAAVVFVLCLKCLHDQGLCLC